MRKLLAGFAFVAVTALIIYAVRGRLQDGDSVVIARAPAADPPLRIAPTLPVSETARLVVQQLAEERPVQAPADTGKTRRPVISRNVPTVAETAPDKVSEATQDPATVLKRASSAYTNMKSMRADFVQRRENPLLGSSMTSRGRLFQRKPDRFLLQFTEPAGDVIVSDGRHFWLYYPSVDNKQVLRSPASKDGAGAVDLQAQFIGDPLRRFRHKYEGRETFNGRSTHVLTLTPRDSDAGYRTLKVWVDGSDYLVRRFRITEQTGAVVEFQLSNLTLNPALGDEIFRFKPPAGARVIER